MVWRRHYKIASFNCRSLATESGHIHRTKLGELVRWAGKHKLQALAIQEPHVAAKGESCGYQYEFQQQCGWLWRGRKWQLHFKEHFAVLEKKNLRLINVYMPHAGKMKQRQVVLDQLRRQADKQKVVILLGDWNTQTTGTSTMTSKAVKQLERFLGSSNKLQRVPLQQMTFYGPREREAELDAFIAPPHLCYATTLLHRPIDSDHRPIKTEFALKEDTEEAAAPAKKRLRFDLTPLRDEETRSHIGKLVAESEAAANPLLLPQVMQRIAVAKLQPKPKIQMADSFDCEEVKQLRHRIEQLPHNNRTLLQSLFKSLTVARLAALSREVCRLCDIFERNVNGLPEFAYMHLKATLLSPKNALPDLNADELRTMCIEQLTTTSPQEQVYFDPRIPGPSSIYCGPFTLMELNQAASTFSNGRAPGKDGFCAEFLQIEEVAQISLDLLNVCWDLAVLPIELKETIFVPIPKSGGGGVRFVALMSVLSKLMDKMILKRLRLSIDRHLRTQQNGFRQRRNCQLHILTRNIVQAKMKAEHQGLQLFIDFRNAFPSVTRPAIIAALRAFHVPAMFTQRIMAMYEGHRAFVGDHPAPFEPNCGVLQGDTLAPYLFILVVDCVMAMTVDKLKRHGLVIRRAHRKHGDRGYRPPVLITDLIYADDIVLFSRNQTNLQILFTALQREAKKVGLYCNAKKTQCINFGPPCPNITLLDGTPIAFVEQYKYLGAWTNVNSNIDHRIKASRAAMAMLTRIFGNCRQRTQENWWNTFVRPVLIYGLEAVRLTKKHISKINKEMHSQLRRIKRKFWQPGRRLVSNARLRGRIPSLAKMLSTARSNLLDKQRGTPLEAVLDGMPQDNSIPTRITGWLRQAYITR